MWPFVSDTDSLFGTAPSNLEMFEKISDFDPNMMFRRLSREKAVGTTTWLANNPVFKRWLIGDMASQHRLWLSGKGMVGETHAESPKC
jgi:hypothetical protein